MHARHGVAPPIEPGGSTAIKMASHGSLFLVLLCALKWASVSSVVPTSAAPYVGFCGNDPLVRRAAHEFRRYVRLILRDGPVMDVAHVAPGDTRLATDGVIFATNDSTERLLRTMGLQPDSIARKFTEGPDRHGCFPLSGMQVLLCTGSAPVDVLYSAFSLIERVSRVRFRLHGDTIPSPQVWGLTDKSHHCQQAIVTNAIDSATVC